MRDEAQTEARAILSKSMADPFPTPESVLGQLRAIKAAALGDNDVGPIIEARDEVLARYSPSFQPGAIASISEDVLRSFLYFENNRHWTGLNRQVNRICADMRATRTALADLVDESKPIQSRMDACTAIKGMGKGIITAILHVAYPDKYGVWNNTSDGALTELGLMPTFDRGAKFGERYAAINEVLNAVARELDVDLWTLDALWWKLDEADGDQSSLLEDAPATPGAPPGAGGKTSFGMERHLQNFMYDNWDDLPLAADWELFTRQGEPDAGYEFSTPVGRIDLLARHRREPRWLVIELKRHGTSDQVVGQILRYVGWIRSHHAEPGESVEGLIVAHEGDDKLAYAVSAVPSLNFKTYEVNFRLVDAPEAG